MTTPHLSSLLREVEAQGWGLLEACPETARPDQLAKRLELAGLRCHTATAMQVLSPRTDAASTYPSLSARYGLASFPAHVDGAHRPIPPRYVLLYCTIDEQARPTRLYPWHALEYTARVEAQLSREVFAYRSGARSMLDSVLDRSRAFVRLDPGCMIPRTRQGESLLASIASAIGSAEAVDVNWEPGRAALIDNWRTLHGRGVARADGRREIVRYTFDIP